MDGPAGVPVPAILNAASIEEIVCALKSAADEETGSLYTDLYFADIAKAVPEVPEYLPAPDEVV